MGIKKKNRHSIAGKSPQDSAYRQPTKNTASYRQKCLQNLKTHLGQGFTRFFNQ